MPSVTLPSPAKLNLFLHITGRRDNGYHDLQTLFQLLDFGDSLTFTVNKSGEIRLSPQISGVLAEDNLIVRAARLLQQKTHCTKGCDIVLVFCYFYCFCCSFCASCFFCGFDFLDHQIALDYPDLQRFQNLL